MDFVAFPKMPRMSREVIVTEKIDGTNAQIAIVELDGHELPAPCIYQSGGLGLYAGSRTRWITPADDNFGFAAWALEHAEELVGLGVGRHFGEWWGRGIQRSYGLADRRFSLFNVHRWSDDAIRPACCHVVPILYRGIFTTDEVGRSLAHLAFSGSKAAPGFMRPEGVVVFHVAGNFGMKKTIEKDEEPKGERR